MKRFAFLVVLSLVLSLEGWGQNMIVVDSLKKALDTDLPAKKRIQTLNELSAQYCFTDSVLATKYAGEAIELSEKIGFSNGVVDGLYSIGWVSMSSGSFWKAIEIYKRALNISSKSGYTKGKADALNGLGTAYASLGKYEQALEKHFQSLKYKKQLGDMKSIAGSYNNIGNVYGNLNNDARALEYYLKAKEIREKINDYIGAFPHYSNIAIVFRSQGMLDSSFYYISKGLKIALAFNDKDYLGTSYESLGILYVDMGDLDSALFYLNKSLTLREEMGHRLEEAGVLVSLGSTQILQKDFRAAIQSLKKALAIADDIDAPIIVRDCALYMSEAHQKSGKYREALLDYQKHIQIRDSLYNQEKVRKVAEIQAEYKFEAASDSLRAHDEIREIELKRVRQTSSLIFLGMISLAVFAFALYRGRLKEKRLNKSLQIRASELNHLNTELLKVQRELIDYQDQINAQNNELSHQKSQMDASIRSAEDIQQALLPFEERLEKLLKEHFIFFRPLNVVSGDFYWAEQVEGKTYLIAADCTGHGVPGAFMSLIGFNLLDRIILQEDIMEPAAILTRLDELVHMSFSRENQGAKLRGMDLSLLVWEYGKDHQVHATYAGAKRPLYYTNEGILHEVKGNKRGIGDIRKHKVDFQQVELVLHTGDMVYIGSDGFVDQNNEARQKYGSNRLKTLFADISQLPAREQKLRLGHELDEHMIATTQRDDILWIAARL